MRKRVSSVLMLVLVFSGKREKSTGYFCGNPVNVNCGSGTGLATATVWISLFHRAYVYASWL